MDCSTQTKTRQGSDTGPSARTEVNWLIALRDWSLIDLIEVTWRKLIYWLHVWKSIIATHSVLVSPILCNWLETRYAVGDVVNLLEVSSCLFTSRIRVLCTAVLEVSQQSKTNWRRLRCIEAANRPRTHQLKAGRQAGRPAGSQEWRKEERTRWQDIDQTQRPLLDTRSC